MAGKTGGALEMAGGPGWGAGKMQQAEGISWVVRWVRTVGEIVDLDCEVLG